MTATTTLVEDLDAAAAQSLASASPQAPPAGAAGTAGRTRFGVLGAYCAASFLCAGAWNTLAPIYAIAQERFDVGAGAVTLVALSMFLTYIPGSILALYVTERYGLRANLLTGASLQCGMSVLKWAGVALCSSPHGAYALLLGGQVMGGLGQPLILNVVARLTMDWCAFACARPRVARRASALQLARAASRAACVTRVWGVCQHQGCAGDGSSRTKQHCAGASRSRAFAPQTQSVGMG
jgi:MFS family permease